jgi:hypothetical protein
MGGDAPPSFLPVQTNNPTDLEHSDMVRLYDTILWNGLLHSNT